MKELTRSDIEESREPWGYTRRVPEGSSSRQLALLPATLGVLCDGLGIFLADDVAGGRVLFWSNPAVWFGILHALYCFAIAAWMFFGRWVWTAPQMGLMSLCMLGVLYTLNLGSLTGVILYGTASPVVKTGLLLASFVWYGFWGGACFAAVPRDLGQRNAAASGLGWVRDCNGVPAVRSQGCRKPTWHAVSPRQQSLHRCVSSAHSDGVVVSRIGDVLWGELRSPSSSLVAPVVSVLGLTFTVFATMMMLVYPAKIVAETGKPVLVDMMTPADAPVPDACPSASQ